MSRVALWSAWFSSLTWKLCKSFFSKLPCNLGNSHYWPLKNGKFLNRLKSTWKSIFEKSGATLPIWKWRKTLFWWENGSQMLHMSFNFVRNFVGKSNWQPPGSCFESSWSPRVPSISTKLLKIWKRNEKSRKEVGNENEKTGVSCVANPAGLKV
jgi:hypothetical protein